MICSVALSQITSGLNAGLIYVNNEFMIQPCKPLRTNTPKIHYKNEL